MKIKIEKITDELFVDAQMELDKVERLYKREYKRDMPFANWLKKVIVDSVVKGVTFTVESLEKEL